MNDYEELDKGLTPKQAWQCLSEYRQLYYRHCTAEYSGDDLHLRETSMPKAFWARPGKQKIHVPVAADIAATSADLLFGEEVKLTCVDEKECDNSEAAKAAQSRLEEIARKNNLHALLNEAAESCSALGDVYLKIGWDRNDARQCPTVQVGQGDAAWPEYRFGKLCAIHFFSNLRVLKNPAGDKAVVLWAYERYEPGRIVTRIFRGSEIDLGEDMGDEALAVLGIAPEVLLSTREMAAVHIPNIRPNRLLRGSMMGRSDFDGLRGLMDALDEAYSSWLRDIRLAKARLIVPVEYLRRKSSDLFPDDREAPPMFEFDEDVETLCALDSDPDKVGANAITPSQFAIRADEHQKTCEDLITQIVTRAGYAPQTFGLNIEGLAQSGTALNIREKKSLKTCGKKQAYWHDALEGLLTAILRIDAEQFPGKGSAGNVHVHVRFADAFASDISTNAVALELLNRADAASTEVKVRMLHPDWMGKEIVEEVARIREEKGIGEALPDPLTGDFAAVRHAEDASGNAPDSPQDGAADAREGTEDD